MVVFVELCCDLWVVVLEFGWEVFDDFVECCIVFDCEIVVGGMDCGYYGCMIVLCECFGDVFVECVEVGWNVYGV